MTQPKVSIIVPTYNVEQYIDECVGSLTNQTMHDIEILLSDDCSTDSSLAILHKLAEQDARIRIIEHERNVSASKCRKDAVLASHGEYIMFSDADDRYELNACAAAYEAIRREGTDIVQFDTFVENCGNVLQSRIDSNKKALAPYYGELKKSLLEECFANKRFSITVWNKIYRGDPVRKAFAKVSDGYFPKANDLYAMFFILQECSTYKGIHDELYHYNFGRGMTGKDMMNVKQFSVHCQSSKVSDAIGEYVKNEVLKYPSHTEVITETDDEGNEITQTVEVPDEKAALLQNVSEIVRKRFFVEQMSLLLNNVYQSDRLEAFEEMRKAWQKDYSDFFANIAKYNWYRKDSIGQLFDGKEEFLQFRQRPIRTVALYYHRLGKGGAQRVVALLANMFAEATNLDGTYKYHVIVVTDEEPSEDDFELSSRVSREVIPDYRLFPTEDYTIRVARWKEIIEKNSVDAILYSGWVSPCVTWDLLCIKSLSSRPAFVIHSHSFFAFMYQNTNSLLKQGRNTYHLADAMVVLSEADRRYWAYSVPRTYMIINPSFTDAALEKSGHFGKNVLWIGRLAAEKQPEHLIRIMAKVVQEDPDVICHILGSGDDAWTVKMQSLIGQYALENNVILEGYHSDMEPFYINGSVVVSTSKYEGFPLTFYEAASYGLPTVAYDMPWLEYFRTMRGYIRVPQGDIIGAANAIHQLVCNREVWEKASNELKQSALEYSKHNILADWEAVLFDISNNKYPENPEMDETYRIMFDQLTAFHTNAIDKLTASNNKKAADIRKKTAEVKKARKSLKNTKNSWSYRIGRKITWPVRKAKSLLK